MGNIFVISDTHFQHSNILKFTDRNTGKPVRPFQTVQDMDETMVENWNKVVKPGDKVEITVQLKPYRDEEITTTVFYTVPKTQPKGTLLLEVRGGGLISLAQLMMKQQGIDLSAEEDKTKPLAEDIKEFLESNKNNEIIVSPAVVNPALANQTKNNPEVKQVQEPVKPSLPEEPAAEGDALPNPEKTVDVNEQKNRDDQVKNKTTVDYIVDNIQRIALKVE